MRVQKKKLCDICFPKQWKTISSDSLQDSGYPVYGANGIIGFYSEYNHEKKTLLITCRGATCGSLNICEPYSYVNGNAMALDNLSEEIDIQYLFYYLQYRGFSDVITGSAQPQIVRNSLEKIYVFYPEITQQKKICDTLDKVCELIALRRKQLERLDLMVKARFVEMFGDPVQNPYNWCVVNMAELGNCKNGMNFHTEDSGIDIFCLGVGDFKNLAYITDTTKLPLISLNRLPSEEYLLKDGDIVFVRSNGNKDLVGRSLLVYPGNVSTTFSGFCIRFRLQSDKVQTDYLLMVLKSEAIRKMMVGRGANIQNLNQKILSELVIPVPPLEKQKRFSLFFSQVDKLKLPIQRSLDTLEVLKKSLMQEYFGQGV